MSEPPPIEPLLTALHDEEMCVRLAVASVFATFTLPFSPVPVLEALAHPDIASYLGTQPLPFVMNNEEREIYSLIVQTLKKLGMDIPREMLLSVALQCEYEEIRYVAIQSLVKYDANPPWEVLLKMIDREGGSRWPMGPACVLLGNIKVYSRASFLEEAFYQGTIERSASKYRICGGPTREKSTRKTTTRRDG